MVEYAPISMVNGARNSTIKIFLSPSLGVNPAFRHD